jgi:hypothetical protein
MEPPFGLGEVPQRLKSAWLAVSSRCPAGIEPVTWEMAMFDTALLIGDFGALIEDYRWTPGDLFDVPRDGGRVALCGFARARRCGASGRMEPSRQAAGCSTG